MLQITFLDMDPSPAVEDRIRSWVGRLARYSGDIQKCQVWISSPRGHHRKGNLYGVRVRLTVPGEEIDIDLQPPQEEVHLAVRKAFEAVRRELQDFERRRRGQVKAHPRTQGDASRRRRIPSRAERGVTAVGGVEEPS